MVQQVRGSAARADDRLFAAKVPRPGPATITVEVSLAPDEAQADGANFCGIGRLAEVHFRRSWLGLTTLVSADGSGWPAPRIHTSHQLRRRDTRLAPDSLSFMQLWAPALFVVGAIIVLGPILPMSRPWARALVCATVWLFVGRYEVWRLSVTAWPASGSWYEVSWVWFCYAVELFATGDALILYLTFLRGAIVGARPTSMSGVCAQPRRPNSQMSMFTYRPTTNRWTFSKRRLLAHFASITPNLRCGCWTTAAVRG